MTDKYKASPEFLWARFPEYAVFRHEDNRKWFALVMRVPRDRLGLDGSDAVDIINLKLSDPLAVDLVTQTEGIMRGYHISRGNWISVLLDGSVPFDTIKPLIDESFAVTASKAKKKKLRAPKEWLIPANPKYYDIQGDFARRDTIEWKQGKGIAKGDTVFMYVGAPVSAILYECEVVECDIPYEYHGKDVSMTALMRIKRRRVYDPGLFPLSRLRDEYGVTTVRGPRGVPHSLLGALREM